MPSPDFFTAGPFTYQPLGEGFMLHGQACHHWRLAYAGEVLAERTMADMLNRGEVREAFAEDLAAFAKRAQIGYQPDVLQLQEEATGAVLAEVAVANWPEGLTPGPIDDRAPLWLVTRRKPTYSMPITLAQFVGLGALRPPALAWVAELLPPEVLTTDAEQWRAPDAWVWRHVVGEASFTGIIGKQAAALIGLTPQYLRKCMASDDAKSRQAISFAHWHLLLQRIGVCLPAPVTGSACPPSVTHKE